MSNCEHLFKSQTSTILYREGKKIHVEVCRCTKCGKLYIKDFETGEKLTLHGAFGPEVD